MCTVYLHEITYTVYHKCLWWVNVPPSPMSITLLWDFPRPSEVRDIRSAMALYVNTVGPSARSDMLWPSAITFSNVPCGSPEPRQRPTQTPSQWVTENTASAHSNFFTWRCRAACMIEGSSERPVEGKGLQWSCRSLSDPWDEHVAPALQ